MNAGKLIIIGIFGVSLAMGVFAWWYRYEQGNEALAFWGTANAVRISGADRVELFSLADIPSSDEPESDEPETLQIAGQSVTVHDRREIQKARGFTHLRHALVQDAAFRWDQAREQCEPHWDYALRFEDAAGEATTIAIDLDCQRVRLVGTDSEAAIRKDLAENLRGWFERETSNGRVGQVSSSRNCLVGRRKPTPVRFTRRMNESPASERRPTINFRFARPTLQIPMDGPQGASVRFLDELTSLQPIAAAMPWPRR